DRGTRSDIIEALHPEELSSILSGLDPEDQGRLVDELPANVTTKLLSAVPASDLGAVMAIAGYGRNSIARRMSPPAVIAWTDDTVAEVTQRLRETEVDLEDVRLIPVLTLDRPIVGTRDAPELLRCPPGTGLARPHEPSEARTDT